MFIITCLIALLFSGPISAAEGEEVVLRGVGATFPDPLYQQWISICGEQAGIRVIYQPVGSSEGINQLKARQVDFGGTDAFIQDSGVVSYGEQILHVPTCVGAVAVTYNLQGNLSLKMNSSVISAIFMGSITNWSDPALKKLNPNVQLPNLPITVVHRADGSGTTFIFTSYLAKRESAWRERVGAGKTVQWPLGMGLDGNAKVADFAKKIEGSIAYMEWAYAVNQKLQFAAIENNSGVFILPSVESISLAAAIELPKNLKILLVDSPSQAGYPISGFTYIIFYAEQKYGGRSLSQAEALGNWLWWDIHQGQKFATALNYAPLPAPAVKLAEEMLRGLNYNGKPVLHTP